MRPPVIGVTGPIASGKTTVARAIAGRRGALVDCDRLAHGALADPGVRRRLVAAFGRGILAPSGGVSRQRLGRVVFADSRALERLNRIVRPRVRAIIEGAVRRARERAEYIVLDAVLLFQYKFKFKIDFVVAASAGREARIRRIVKRDGIRSAEAARIVERQEGLERGWAKADRIVDTDRPAAEARREAARIRDEFLARYFGPRGPSGARRRGARRSGTWRRSSRTAR